MPEPIEVKPLNNFRIVVRYSDKVAGEISLLHLKKKSEYKKLFAKKEFVKVFIDDISKNICWECGVSLCKDAIYKQIVFKMLMKRLRIDISKS